MLKNEHEWSQCYRQTRGIWSEELSFWVTPTRDFRLMFKKEDMTSKAINLAFLLGIPLVFVFVAVFKIDHPLPKSIFLIIAAIVIFAVSGRLKFSLLIDRGAIETEIWHFGLRTGTRRVLFADDCRFRVVSVMRSQSKSNELVLTNGREKHSFFVVRDAKEFSNLLDEMNEALEELLATRESKGVGPF